MRNSSRSISVSIRALLGLGIVGFLVVFFGLALIFSYVASGRSLEFHMRALMGEQKARVEQNVDSLLSGAQNTVLSVARALARDGRGMERREQVEFDLFNALLSEPALSGVYVGWPTRDFVYVKRLDRDNRRFRTLVFSARDGMMTRYWRDGRFGIVEGPEATPSDFDPRTRPWFAGASETQGVFWTDPYLFNDSRRPGVSAAVASRGPDGAVVGADLDLFGFSEFLNQVTASEGGGALVVDRANAVIASTDFARIAEPGALLATLPTVADLSNDALTAAMALTPNAPGQGDAITALSADGKDYHWQFGALASNAPDWRLGLLVPDAPYMEPLKSTANLFLLAALAASAIVAGLTLWATRAITRPVVDLAGIAGDIRDRGFGAKKQIATPIREINELGQVLEELVTTLADKERQNAKLTRDLSEINTSLDRLAAGRDGAAHSGNSGPSAEETRDFIAVLAHEIRSPLAKISTMAQMIALTETSLSRAAAERLDKINENSTQMVGMIRMMLTSFSLTAREISMNPRETRIEPMLTEIFDRSFSLKDLDRIDLKVAPADLGFLLDPDLAGMAVTNAVSNALKYSPPQMRVLVEISMLSGRLAVSVTDRGPGMSEEDRRQFGRRFSRGKSAGSAAGAGLGGYIIRMIVEAHRGEVEIDSDGRNGSTVRLLFPDVNAGDAR